MSLLGECGVAPAALRRCIEEQVYTLPGAKRPRGLFTVVLTGSRAVGLHTPESDIDLDVLCPQPAYESVLAASFAADLIKSAQSFFRHIPDAGRYFGERNAHLGLTSLARVEQQFRDYEDVPIWVWSNARIIVDPGDQFGHLREGFQGYPKSVLIRKIKYRWLLSDYWAIDVYPHHHRREDQLLPAAAAMSNAVLELLRFFFLVEGKPFPYAEHLARLSQQTALGRRFFPLLCRIGDLIVGRSGPAHPWQRLDEAFRLLENADLSPEAQELWEACAEAMIAMGLDPQWVEAGYDNIDQLLSGDLGPPP